MLCLVCMNMADIRMPRIESGIVDESLAVALYEVETPHFLFGQRHVGYPELVVGNHLVVEHVSQQPHPALGKIIVYRAVDVRYVDPLVDQHGDGPEQVRGQAAEREIAVSVMMPTYSDSAIA